MPNLKFKPCSKRLRQRVRADVTLNPGPLVGPGRRRLERRRLVRWHWHVTVAQQGWPGLCLGSATVTVEADRPLAGFKSLADRAQAGASGPA
jgi:hypothetical protein